jgi:hypothetical protein
MPGSRIAVAQVIRQTPAMFIEGAPVMVEVATQQSGGGIAEAQRLDAPLATFFAGGTRLAAQSAAMPVVECQTANLPDPGAGFKQQTGDQ